MARVDGYTVDVPLLMVYWYATSPTPSTVIVLDSTVVFPVDMEDKLRWDAFRFDIRNAKTVTTNTTIDRVFTAPKKARDSWMYVISQALLMYEKASAKARKESIIANEARRCSPPHHEEFWAGESFVTAANPLHQSPPRRRPIASPPTSPASRNSRLSPKPKQIPKRPIPRPRSTSLGETTP